jgi:hypothetical protein
METAEIIKIILLGIIIYQLEYSHSRITELLKSIETNTADK